MLFWNRELGLTGVLGSLAVTILLATSAQAKPNCDVNPNHPSCTDPGSGPDTTVRRVRVMVEGGSSIQAGGTVDAQQVCTGDPGFTFWHTATGPLDTTCETVKDQRVLSAGGSDHIFNTFGDNNRKSPGEILPNRWVTIDFSQGQDCSVFPDIDDELYGDPAGVCNSDVECEAHFPEVDNSDCVDNVEIHYQTPTAFGLENSVTVNGFDIDIQAPVVKRNGSMQWTTRYVIEFNSTTLTPQSAVETDLTTTGPAVLRRVSDGLTWNVNVPLDWLLKVVVLQQ